MNRRGVLSGFAAMLTAALLPFKGTAKTKNETKNEMLLLGVEGAFFPKDWRDWVSVDAITVYRKCSCGHTSYVRYDWTHKTATYLPDYPENSRYSERTFGFNEDVCYDCSWKKYAGPSE